MQLDYEDTTAFLESVMEAAPCELTFDAENRLVTWREGEESKELQLSMLFPIAAQGLPLVAYLESLSKEPPNYLVILIRAGTASIGYYVAGELEAHKVIRKYMVRKSQGRMQIAYLSKKGKSRAGSRVRLRESVEFFEEINQKLADYIDELGEPEIVFHSCPVRLKTHWFSSNIAPPFASDDERLRHIPFHVHQPDHDELLRIHRLLSLSRLSGAGTKSKRAQSCSSSAAVNISKTAIGKSLKVR